MPRDNLGRNEKQPMCVLRLIFMCCCCTCIISAQSAGEMLSACKQISSAKTNERVTMLPRDFDSGLCWGAFGTLEQFVKTPTSSKRSVQRISAICLPEDATRVRLIAVVAEFLKTHPERNQEQFYPVAFDALQAAFPCQPGSVRGKGQ